MAGTSTQPTPVPTGMPACLPAPPLQTIEGIERDFKPPTMAVQETWRFIAIAGALGMLCRSGVRCALPCFASRAALRCAMHTRQGMAMLACAPQP